MSAGLTRCWSKPAASDRSRSFSWPQPVSATSKVRCASRKLADAPRDLVAVHLRHADVEEHDVGTVRLDSMPSAACPSWATATCAPRISSSAPRLSAASWLSSTTRMRAAASTAAARRHRADGRPRARRRLRQPAGARSRRCPGPAVAFAATLPPCISTRLRTSVSPMPRPPGDAQRASVALGEHLEDPRQECRVDTDAGVAAHPRRSPRRRAARSGGCCPPLSVYLAALLSRLEKTCARRVGSASSQTGSGGSCTSSVCSAASMTGGWFRLRRPPPPPAAPGRGAARWCRA